MYFRCATGELFIGYNNTQIKGKYSILSSKRISSKPSFDGVVGMAYLITTFKELQQNGRHIFASLSPQNVIFYEILNYFNNYVAAIGSIW